MIAPPYSQLRLAGTTWTIRPPDTAIEVLECDVFHACHVDEHRGVMPRAQDVDAVQRWCAAYIVAVEERPAWSSYTPEERAAVLDRELDWREAEKLRAAIVETAGLPEAIVEGVVDFYEVAEKGGCECPICERDKEPTPALKEACLYEGVPANSIKVVNSTFTLGDAPALDAPWWLYQLQQAQARGRGRARQERRRKQRNRQMADNVLQERGIKV